MYKFIVVLLLAIVSSSAYSNETLDVVVGLAKPPYVHENQKDGYELDLIRNVLKKINVTPNYLFVPFGRSQKMLDAPNVDALLTTNTRIIQDANLLSDTYIIYQNVAISLAKSNLDIKRIEDLSKYSIAAFQQAHKVLGSDFAKAAIQSPMYTQVPRQESQLELLFRERIDTIVLDINIFNYFRSKLSSEFADIEVTVHKVFPKTPYKMAFKDKSLIEPFNLALREYIRTEEYEALKKHYGFTTLN